MMHMINFVNGAGPPVDGDGRFPIGYIERKRLNSASTTVLSASSLSIRAQLSLLVADMALKKRKRAFGHYRLAHLRAHEEHTISFIIATVMSGSMSRKRTAAESSQSTHRLGTP